VKMLSFIGALIVLGMITAPLSAQMRPGAGTAIISAQDQEANAEADDRLEGINPATRTSRIDSVDWARPEWLTEPAPRPIGTAESADSDDSRPESAVERRALALRQEANQRWYERRIHSNMPFEGRSYPEVAGWFTPEGDPVPERWPWWLW
jgi:hypothetical protein